MPSMSTVIAASLAERADLVAAIIQTI